MPKLDIMAMDRLYKKKWVALDHALKVVDHDADYRVVRERADGRGIRCTLFFVPGAFLPSLS